MRSQTPPGICSSGLLRRLRGIGQAPKKAKHKVGNLVSDRDRKAAALASLAALYPWMKPFQVRPVRDYALRLFDPPASRSQLECRIVALHKLLNRIQVAAIGNRLPDQTAKKICKDVEERRVLQTGPHLLLVVEPEAFYTHIFSLIGLSAHGCSTYVSYAVSTVSLVERTRKGPGWLAVDGKAINIFGLSRSRMTGYGLLTGLGPYQFQLATTDPGGQVDALTHLRTLLPTARFDKPAHAIKAANLSLWPTLFGHRFAFLQLDDEDVADLVADHLNDSASWLRLRLLETPKVASGIVEGIDRLAIGPWAGWLTRGTDFFWFYDHGRRVPLRLEGQHLVHHATGVKVVRFEASEITAWLFHRRLIPNMFLAFMVLAILPGIRVLGGSHQTIYFPLMRYIMCRALEAAGVDADLQHSLATDDVPGAWGHRVIGTCRDPFDLFRALGPSGISAAINQFGGARLIDACGDMTGFVQDGAWSDLHERIKVRAIALTDPEWAFS